MDSVVFDARRVEPHPVVCASGRSVDVVAQVAALGENRGLAQPKVSAAAVLPYPTGDRNAVTVTQGVNHRSNAREVMAATGEAIPPTMPLRGPLDHCCTVSVISVRPLFAQFAEFHDAAASVVVGYPTGKLIGCDGGNEHGDGAVEALATTTHMVSSPFSACREDAWPSTSTRVAYVRVSKRRGQSVADCTDWGNLERIYPDSGTLREDEPTGDRRFPRPGGGLGRGQGPEEGLGAGCEALLACSLPQDVGTEPVPFIRLEPPRVGLRRGSLRSGRRRSVARRPNPAPEGATCAVISWPPSEAGRGSGPAVSPLLSRAPWLADAG